jgi:hypothetical protein
MSFRAGEESTKCPSKHSDLRKRVWCAECVEYLASLHLRVKRRKLQETRHTRHKIIFLRSFS